MQNARRLGLAMLLLSAAFLVLVGMAAAALWAAGQAGTAVVMGVIGLAGAAAGAITWRVARAEEVELPDEKRDSTPIPRSITRTPVCIQTMPVADLPPAYLDAIMKGTHARLNALKAQSSHSALAGK
jgi:hypothetical protein